MKWKILVVDDHEIMRKTIIATINGNYQVCGEGSSGEEAVNKAIDLKPDLIVMDVSMPGTSGIEAARRIRELLPIIKIILVSVHDSVHLNGDLKSAPGVDAFLPKMSLGTELVKTINLLLGTKELV